MSRSDFVPSHAGSAFVTGSHAYGKAGEASDLDLVVLMGVAEARRLMDVLEVLFPLPEDEQQAYGGFGSQGFRRRAGAIDLIVCTCPKRYEEWRKGTKELIAIAPVSREAAVDHFKAIFNAGQIVLPGSVS